MEKGHWNTTYAWALVQACIKRYLMLEVGVCTIPVIVTFEKEQLELSEVLLTTLNRSLETGFGYNIVTGGGETGATRSRRSGADYAQKTAGGGPGAVVQTEPRPQHEFRG